MAVRSAWGSTRTVMPSSISGIGGNPLASMPLMWAVAWAQARWSSPDPSGSSRSIRSLGREFTSSVSSRAGTVISPSSWMTAPAQVVMNISRLVAESLSLESFAQSSTFWVMARGGPVGDGVVHHG